MDIEKIIVLENREEYLILDKVLSENREYYYIAKVNITETDIEDNYKLITIDEKDGGKVIVEVTGEDSLRKILPLFTKQL